MGDVVLEFDHVWKKFKKGERHDSLRDFIPALAKRFFNSNQSEELEEKEFWALKDVSFQVEKGEAIGLVGHNGAGKSTLLKLLIKLLKPNKGNIKVHGRISSLIEVGAGFHPDLTGRENIYLNGTILGMKKDQIDRKFDEIVAFSELESFIDTPVKRYSSGMYARLGFSVAAHVDPEILLVDEVLSVGDYTFTGKCIKKMNEVIKNGTTILFVSHNMDSVLSICNRVILLQKGEIKKSGAPRDVIDEYFNLGGIWTPPFSKIQKANIKNVTFEYNNSAKSALLPGTHLKCRVIIESKEDCKLSPGFFIRERGVLVFSTTYGRMTGKVISLSAGQSVELVWDVDLNLPYGHYDLGLHLEDAETSEFYAHSYKFTSLVVADDSRYEGKFHLNPSTEVRFL